MLRDPYPFIPEVALLLERDGHVFLIRRCNTGYKDGEYCLPAGHKERWETPLEAAMREGFEEAGVEIDPADVEFLHVLHRRVEEHERVAFFFRARNWRGDPINQEPDKCDAVGWFALSGLPENTVGYHRHALGRIGEGERYGMFEG
jgi:8-oxo-dGTP diphosphatase